MSFLKGSHILSFETSTNIVFFSRIRVVIPLFYPFYDLESFFHKEILQ
ncbi:hypothetical protein LEP1GSC072_4236 [Leptospira noguchii str. Bonito]|nr:hypothetical protein LEP1GSC072_4236 [Leptospira noguchii str. Bonito]